MAKALIRKKGYSVRSRKGSHVSLVHDYLAPVTIPLHKELKRGLLNHIMKLAGLTASDLD